MEIEASARYPSADAMADALEPFMSFSENATASHRVVASGDPTMAGVPRRTGSDTIEHGGVARLDHDSEPAWATGGGGGGGGGDGPHGPRDDSQGRHFTADEYPGREKKGQHNLAIAMVAALAVVGGVFFVLRSTSGDGDAAPEVDAAAVAMAADAGTIGERPPIPDAAPAAARPDAAAQAKKPEPDPKEPVKKAEPDKKKPDSNSSGGSRDPPRGGKVTVTFLVIPPSARVIASGGQVSGKRLIAERGNKPITVKLQAPGYHTQVVSVIPDKSHELVRTLARKPEPEPEEPEPPQEEPKPEPAKEEPKVEPKPQPSEPTPAPTPPAEPGE
jgi:outer membrane biosynthesis protein TonB